MEDKLLIWKLNRGSKDALCRIYEKYRDDLVRIAAGLLNDVSAAEDIVQDVFLLLVHSAEKYEIRKSLKGYLTSCVANKVRNLNRTKRAQEPVSLDEVKPAASNCKAPDQYVVCDEEFQHLYKAMKAESTPAISLGIDIKLANGDKDQWLVTGYMDYGVNGILSKEMGPVSGHANLGYTIVGVAEGAASENTLSYAAALEYPVNDTVNIVGEVFGSSAANASTNPLDAQIGANWALNDMITVDGGLDFGLTDASPEYKATVGITLTI